MNVVNYLPYNTIQFGEKSMKIEDYKTLKKYVHFKYTQKVRRGHNQGYEKQHFDAKLCEIDDFQEFNVYEEFMHKVKKHIIICPPKNQLNL